MLAVLPTLCSLVCLLAAARLCGAKMNLANIVAIPLLIGIDVDYGIFLVSVSRRSTTRAELLDRVAASSQAVVLCALGDAARVRLAGVHVGAGGALAGLGGGDRGQTCAVSSLFCSAAASAVDEGSSRATQSRRWRRHATHRGCRMRAALRGSHDRRCSPPSGRLSFPTEPIETRPRTANGTTFITTGSASSASRTTARAASIGCLYDSRGDGRVDREYRLADYANDRVPHLILLLDSIPFETMARAV